MPAFTIVGPPDKAAFEARERVRSAMIASGLALAARRITINLALTVGPPGTGKSMLASRLPDPDAAGRPNSSKSPWSPPSPVSFEGGALTHRFSLSREAANAMRLSARGYHRVLLVARTLPSSAVGDVDRPAHADRGKKFMPRLGVVPEHTQHAARDHADAGLVDAAGGHALMRRLGDDGDAVRL